MQKRSPWILVPAGALALAACAAAGSPTTAPTLPGASTVTTLAECPPAPYAVGVLPSRVADAAVGVGEIEVDEFTSIPGTHSTLWLDGEGVLAVALIRGSLPPRDWPGDKGVVSIDGVDAAVGPFEDGVWVAGWYEEPGARCDLYTMVWYQPVDPAEVEATLASLDRTAG